MYNVIKFDHRAPFFHIVYNEGNHRAGYAVGPRKRLTTAAQRRAIRRARRAYGNEGIAALVAAHGNERLRGNLLRGEMAL